MDSIIVPDIQRKRILIARHAQDKRDMSDLTQEGVWQAIRQGRRIGFEDRSSSRKLTHIFCSTVERCVKAALHFRGAYNDAAFGNVVITMAPWLDHGKNERQIFAGLHDLDDSLNSICLITHGWGINYLMQGIASERVGPGYIPDMEIFECETTSPAWKDVQGTNSYLARIVSLDP